MPRIVIHLGTAGLGRPLTEVAAVGLAEADDAVVPRVVEVDTTDGRGATRAGHELVVVAGPQVVVVGWLREREGAVVPAGEVPTQGVVDEGVDVEVDVELIEVGDLGRLRGEVRSMAWRRRCRRRSAGSA